MSLARKGSHNSSSVARFLEDVKSATTQATRVLVVSRAEPEIRQALRAGDPGRLSEYQITPEDVRHDTTVFSRSIIDRKLPNKKDDERADLSKTMTGRCEGQFLWLKMQEESIESDMNLRHIQRLLERTPLELGHSYQRNWDKIEHNAQPPCGGAVALGSFCFAAVDHWRNHGGCADRRRRRQSPGGRAS
jgi:hypothetical protein